MHKQMTNKIKKAAQTVFGGVKTRLSNAKKSRTQNMSLKATGRGFRVIPKK